VAEYDVPMQDDVLSFFRLLAMGVFFVTLYVGWYLLRNFDRLFGKDPNIPSENGSARAYSKVQVFALWGHLLIASAAFALLLH
jgi:hypothetical protein